MPAGMDDFLAHALDVAGIFLAFFAVAALSGVPVNGIVGWLADNVAFFGHLALAVGLAIALASVYEHFAQSRQDLNAWVTGIASAIVAGAIAGFGETMSQRFISGLRALGFSDPRFASAYMIVLLRVVQVTIILWIVDSMISDTFWANQ